MEPDGIPFDHHRETLRRLSDLLQLGTMETAQDSTGAWVTRVVYGMDDDTAYECRRALDAIRHGTWSAG